MNKLKKGIVLITTILLVFFITRYFYTTQKESNQVLVETQLIATQIKNVGKLVVTEGTYAEVLNYKDTKSLMAGLIDAEKKALVVVNAKATMTYDLSKIQTKIIPEKKQLIITALPEPELNIYPDIEYYDVSQDYFNPFNAEDYNTIKERVTQSLHTKIAASPLRANAQNRLLSELQKLYIVTNTLEWTLYYEETPVTMDPDGNFKL